MDIGLGVRAGMRLETVNDYRGVQSEAIYAIAIGHNSLDRKGILGSRVAFNGRYAVR